MPKVIIKIMEVKTTGREMTAEEKREYNQLIENIEQMRLRLEEIYADVFTGRKLERPKPQKLRDLI